MLRSTIPFAFALLQIGCAAGNKVPVAPSPEARLAEADRWAQAHPDDAGAQARAGWLRYLVSSDPRGAEARFLSALAARARAPQARVLAWAGLGEIAEDRLDGADAARAFIAAVEEAPEDPLAELGARRLLDLQGDSAGIDEAIVGAADRFAAGAPRTARLLREAAGRAAGNAAATSAGVAREAERWRAAGALQRFRVGGPFAAYRLLDLGRALALDGPARTRAPPAGPAGPAPERDLFFPDGDVGFDLEPWDGDVFYAQSAVVLERGGDYLLCIEGAAAFELRLDGEVAVSRSPWPREVPRAQEVAVHLAKGTHDVLARWSRAEGGRFRASLERADGRPSDATTRAPVHLEGSRSAAAPCGLGQSCVRAPQWRDEGGLRGAAERLLRADAEDPLGAYLLARATLGDDRRRAREAIDRLLVATGSSAPALLLRVQAGLHDPEAPERIARSRALADLAEAARRDPLLLRARLSAAALQRESERFDDAGEQLDRAEQALADLVTAQNSALARTPKAPPRLLLARARLFDAQGNGARALALARQVLAVEDRCDARLFAVELARRESGAPDRATLAAGLRMCESGRPTLAGLLRERGELAQAQELLEVAAAARPSAPARLEQLAELLIARRMPAEAISTLESAARAAPRSPEPLRRLAEAHEGQGDRASATAARGKALALQPGDLQLRRQIASAGGGSVLSWADRDGQALARKRHPAAREMEQRPSTLLLLDQGSLQIFPDGGGVERIHTLARVLDKRGVERNGEAQIPGDAAVLELRTLKADGRVLEPEAIPEKEGVTLPGLEPGDAVEIDYLRGIAPRGADLPGLAAGPFFFRDEEVPLVESVYEARAPASAPLQVDAHGLPTPPRIETVAGEQRIRAAFREMAPARPEPNAPTEAETMPWLQVGSGSGQEALFPSLADWVLLRARPGSAIEAIARAAPGDTPAQRARALHAAIAQAVRGRSRTNDFSSSAAHVLAEGRGNRLLPLKAALFAAGIPSHLVLLRPFGAPLAPVLFPHDDRFTHAVLRVELPEGPSWIDPSLRLAPFGRLPPFVSGSRGWTLPEPGESAQEVQIATWPASEDGRTTRLEFTLALDGTARGTGRDEHRGFAAAALKDALERLDDDQRRKAVESFLAGGLRSVALDSLSVEGEGTVGGDASILYALRGQLGRTEGRELLVAASLAPARLQRRWAQRAERQLPLLIDEDEAHDQRVEIHLPPGLHLRPPLPCVDLQTPFGSFTWRAREEDGTLFIEEALTLPHQRVPTERYAAFAAFARAVDEAEQQELHLERGSRGAQP